MAVQDEGESMSDFRVTPPDQRWSETDRTGNGYQGPHAPNASSSYEHDDGPDHGEIGRALLVGVLGGLVSVAGYLVYRRLPDEQRERLHGQVRSMVQQRISEFRQNFNI
jgi:hypothetical protein